MLSCLLFRRVLFIVLSIFLATFPFSGTASAANGTDENDAGVEVMTRGPVHEAFADVSVDETQRGPVISRPAPEPINEIPPEYRPEGNQVEWIPGYWSWDDDQDDFIWVSGVWRDVPPGRQWVPGYWLAVEGGSQYISGYWTDINQSGTEYLPPPPQPLEVGPSSPVPSPDFVWIDGNWIWSQNGYGWQAGYWHPQRPDMVWIPAHYVWTPRGYISTMGYWDYPLDRRGLMFAPLHYPRPIYRNHNYMYTPSVVLDTNAVVLSLFIRDSRHYYFGDYYEPRYEKRGFRPWYSEHATRYGHDPFYRSFRSRQLRHDKQWENNYRQQFQYRRDHRDARPPQRFEPTRGHKVNQPRNPASQNIGRLFSNVVENRAQSKQFTRLQPDRRRNGQSQNQKYNNFQAERRKLEMTPHTDRGSLQPTSPQRVQRNKPSALPVNPMPERTKYNTTPQNKPRESENRRQSQQWLNTNQAQGTPQATPRYNPRQRSGNQPQIVPQERKRQSQQGLNTNQAQGTPQAAPRYNPHQRSGNQPQKVPQERKRQSQQGLKYQSGSGDTASCVALQSTPTFGQPTANSTAGCSTKIGPLNHKSNI